MVWRCAHGLDIILELIFVTFSTLSFSDLRFYEVYRQWLPCTTSCLSLCNFAHLFFYGLKMCMWLGFNPAVNFCHFSILLTLSFFAGATSTSPKFDLFSWLFLIRSFIYLQVTRTCIKSRTSSNFGQIGPLTTE